MNVAELLEARGISKSFHGVPALREVDFTVRSGEIHALMGENGAGKSTLIRCLTGAQACDRGELRLDGQAIRPGSPQAAQGLGISTVYQEVNLVPLLSVAENICLGREPRRAWGIDWSAVRERARTALSRLHLEIDVTRPVGSYPIAIQQLTAIARALDQSARVLILDEPTSSLDAAEVSELFGVLRRLRQQGLGLIFVTHFLEQVYAISDRITVLRNGRLVGEYRAESLPRLDLIARMMGKELAELELAPPEAWRTDTPAPEATARPPLLAARGLGRRGSIEPFDLEIRSGEILGLAGLLGSGRTELVRTLFGIDPPDQGRLELGGRPSIFRRARDAARAGLGFCPEDRKAQAIIPDLSIRANVALALQAKRGWFRYLRPRRQREIAERFVQALGIKAGDLEQPIRNLSGGNQQKVILARWLAAEPRLLILDEPTRGIDVGAKAEILKTVLKLCADGMALILISSELEEVVRCSHRVAVLRDRRKVGELAGSEVTEAAVLRQIAGETADGGSGG